MALNLRNLLNMVPVRSYATVKRRKRYPFFWMQDKFRAYYDENLTTRNEEFFQQFLKDKYTLNRSKSPLKTEPWSTTEQGIVRTSLMSGLFNNTRGPSNVKLVRFSSTTSIPNNIQIEDYLELKVDTKGEETIVSAEPRDTGRKVINKPSEACALCRLNLKGLSYTDVMILSQFIKRDGSLATYHESKLCTKQYITIKRLIKQAQRCNLIDRPADYLVPGPWHDLNTYIEPDRRRDQPMKVIKKQYWKV